MTLKELILIIGLLISIFIFIIGNKMDNKLGNISRKSLLQAVGLSGIIMYVLFLILYACLFIDWNYKIF